MGAEGVDVSALEGVIDPARAIVDAHQHFWDGQLRTTNCRVDVPPYALVDLLQDLQSGHRVVATVAVESFSFYRREGPELFYPVGETEHAAALARTYPGIAAAIVAHADLRVGSAVEEVVTAHMTASNRVRAIRHSAAWDPDSRLQIPLLADSVAPEMLASSAFQAGARRIAALGLSFETYLYHPQIDELVGFARALPELPIILDHAGGPVGVHAYAADDVFANWLRGLRRLATCPNVWLKLGGLTMGSTPVGAQCAYWRSSESLASSLRPWLRAAIDAFSPARCLFESNFPVEKRTCSYRVLWNAYKRVAGEYTLDEQAAMLSRNAIAVYRIAMPKHAA